MQVWVLLIIVDMQLSCILVVYWYIAVMIPKVYIFWLRCIKVFQDSQSLKLGKCTDEMVNVLIIIIDDIKDE